MRLRKTITGLALGATSLAGSALYRRRTAKRIERVELYGADGSMASLPDGSPEADRILSLARDLLALAG